MADAVDVLNGLLSDRTEQLDRMRRAARAFEELSICYRIDKRPSERLFKELAVARQTMQELGAC